jgi:hypothetical protein
MKPVSPQDPPAGPAMSQRLRKAADAVAAPLVYPAAWFLGRVRKHGVERLPRCRAALLRSGVFPIRDHYYEPRFDLRDLRRPLAVDRPLPGIDWNVEGQLALLDSLTFAGELAGIPGAGPRGRAPGARAAGVQRADTRSPGRDFRFGNLSFEAGDAEVWYQMIRRTKPARIVEIGGGHSTLLALRAIRANRAADPAYECTHVCIEPYEDPWLEAAGARVVRRRVEDADPALFGELGRGDILFIDSSHVVRPQGDVLFEYLELLPALAPGVIVHVHDVFSPRDYPESWLVDMVRLWNEQYLLEAFLTHNSEWTVLAALNHLQHHHHERLRRVAPYLTPDDEPGSFYLQRRG